MITSILLSIIHAYILIIFVYVLMSWFAQGASGILGEVYRALGVLCDWYLEPFKRIIPPIGGVVDITPIIAVIVLELIARIIVIIL